MYDIVLIDIEPHGREIDVYDKIRHLLKPTHMCILKHVASIDLVGAGYADAFIDEHRDTLWDFFGENDASSADGVRDVFVILSNEHTRDIKCQHFARGRLAKYSGIDVIRGYCKVC
jgi:hypothetical protein